MLAHKAKPAQTKNLPFMPAHGKWSVFCTYTNRVLKICPCSKYIRAKLLEFVSCPFSPDNQTPMHAPPEPQKNIFSVFVDMPNQKSPNIIKPFKSACRFHKKSKPRNSQNQRCEANQKMPITVFWGIFTRHHCIFVMFLTWHRCCPPLSNPYLCNTKKEVDKLPIFLKTWN